ncbi:hypothetical protein EXIGLDRAFT_755665, partial [Exidia glandulosa HHB12029]
MRPAWVFFLNREKPRQTPDISDYCSLPQKNEAHHDHGSGDAKHSQSRLVPQLRLVHVVRCACHRAEPLSTVKAMSVARDRLRCLPDELLLEILDLLSRGDQARAARCSRHLYARAVPLFWKTLHLRIPWTQAKRICITLRRNASVAALVQHFDLFSDTTLRGAWADALVVLPVLVSALSKLVNLRVLVFHFGTKVQSGMLKQCIFPRLESLKMALTEQNVDFVASHPTITALDSMHRSSWDIGRRLGTGCQLAYISAHAALLVDMLANYDQRSPYRRLAYGCYVRLDDAFWTDHARALCTALNNTDVRIGLLHLTGHLFIQRRVPGGVTTDRIDGLRLTFLRRHAYECYDGAQNLLTMCIGVQTLEFESAPGEVIDATEASVVYFRETLSRFSRACTTLHTVVTAWGRRWEKLDGTWIELPAFGMKSVDPFL